MQETGMPTSAIVLIVVLAPVILGLIIAGGVFLTRAMVQEERKKETVFHEIARRLGGTFEPGEWMRPGRMRITLSGRPAEIRFERGSDDTPPHTCVQIDLRGRSPGTLSIAPEGFGASLAKMFGAQDIEIGDREFDGLYVIKAHPESLAHRIFSPERRARVVAAVRALFVSSGGTLHLTREWLRVGRHDLIDHEAGLIALVERAKEFLEAILETSAGAEVLWVEETKVGGLCQVCGTEMSEGIVHCAACRTPHHEECWQYVGECSTYACKEKRYVRDGRRVVAPPQRPAGRTPRSGLVAPLTSFPTVEESLGRFEQRQRERGRP